MKQKFLRYIPIMLIGSLGAGFFLYKVSLLGALPLASKFDDSSSYLRVANLPLFSIDFWTSSRPPFVPLVYRLAGNDLYRISVVQSLFSAVCWLLLAVMVARSIKSFPVKVLSFSLIILFCLSADILRWDTIVMSESISISLFALWLANWLWIGEGWHWRKAFTLGVVTAAFIFSRETNAWTILMVAAVLLVAGLIWRSQRMGLILSAIFFMLFIVNAMCSDAGKRWVMPFLNVLGTRILPTQEYLAYFESQGMPVNDTLMQYENHWSTRLRKEIEVNPELQEFNTWLKEHGKSTYMRFLVTHPEPLLQDPLRNFETMMSAKVEMYTPAGFDPLLGKSLDEILFPRKWIWLLAAIFPLVTGFLIPLVISGKGKQLLLPFVMLALVFPQAVISFNGDTMGLSRHPFLAAVELRLGLWLTALYGIDRLAEYAWAKRQPILAFFKRGRNSANMLAGAGAGLIALAAAVELLHGLGPQVIGWKQWVAAGVGVSLIFSGLVLGARDKGRE